MLFAAQLKIAPTPTPSQESSAASHSRGAAPLASRGPLRWAHLDWVAFTGTVFSLARSADRRSSRMVGADSPVPVPPCVPELRSRPSPVGATITRQV